MSSNEGARGATVAIDGSSAGVLFNTPIRIADLSGRHLVSATREGYEAVSQWIEVEGGQTVRVNVVLERGTGSIFVDANFADMTVLLDGTAVGVTPVLLSDVPIGWHTVEVRASTEGVAPHRHGIQVVGGERATVHAELGLSPETAPSWSKSGPRWPKLRSGSMVSGSRPAYVERMVSSPGAIESSLRRPATSTTGTTRWLLLAKWTGSVSD